MYFVKKEIDLKGVVPCIVWSQVGDRACSYVRVRTEAFRAIISYNTDNSALPWLRWEAKTVFFLFLYGLVLLRDL